jgi:hypothetical protein
MPFFILLLENLAEQSRAGQSYFAADGQSVSLGVEPNLGLLFF